MSDPTRRGVIRTLAATGIASLAGCSGRNGGNAGNDGGTDGRDPGPPRIADRWVTGTATAARTLLPHRASEAASRDRLRLVLDGTYAITGEDERFPYWLSLEEIGAGERYEATIREGLRWSDPHGSMTADDWVYYVREIHKGPDNWAGSRLAPFWEGVEVGALDERTFEIVLEEPNVEFPTSPALRRSFCLPRSLIEPYVTERDREGLESDETIASLSYTGNLGPYVAESREPDERFVATRNDDYYMRNAEAESELWAEAPYFESYEYRVYDDERARLGALRSGDVTTTTVPPARFEAFAGDEDRQFYRVPQDHVTTLAFNQRANGWAPLRKTRVRRALAMAIGKERIAESVLRGYGEPIHTFQPARSEWHAEYESPGIGEGYSYREAMTELEAALGPEYGYGGGTLLDPDGEPVELTFVHASDGDRPTALAELIERELEHLGIAIDRRAVGFGTLLESYVANDWRGEGEPPWTAGEYNAGPREESASAEPWDLLCGLGLNAYPDAPAATARYWLEDGDMNFTGYVPEADLTGLYERARAGEDREAALEEVFAVLATERPVDFLASQDAIVGYRRSIVGPEESAGDWDRQTWHTGRR